MTISWTMFFMIYFLSSGYFCTNFIKNEIFPKITAPICKKILVSSLILYFILSVFLKLKSLYLLIYFLLPCLFVLFLFYFLEKRSGDTLLSHLQGLLNPLSSQMRLGCSFMTAWDKMLENSDIKMFKEDFSQITNALKFGAYFRHSDKKIEHLVQDLVEVKNSSQPSKRLKRLIQKIKIESHFYRKSKQALFQLKLQSQIVSIFYLILLCWILSYSGINHPKLILLSFLLFNIGFIVILKIGETMKWSL